MTDLTWHLRPEHFTGSNIANDSDLYEVENLAADPDRTVEAAMKRIAPWDGKVVLDLGAGTGFHVPRFHETAAHVVAVEPGEALRLKLMSRVVELGLTNTSVIGASAAELPLRDHSVDIVHARFAYFFGTGCEPGLRELERVIAPGGTAFIIDNDLRSGTFGEWVRNSYEIPDDQITEDEQFWLDQGFTIERLPSRWLLKCRKDFEDIIRLEFPVKAATDIVESHDSLDIDYNLLLIHRTY